MNIFTLEFGTLPYPALHELLHSRESQNKSHLHEIMESKDKDKLFVTV